MKILIVSYFFPPFNAVGAVRVGKMAKYLVQAGHEVKVLSADHQPLMATLPVELDEQHIVRTSWINVNRPVQMLLGGKKSVAKKGFERAGVLPGFVRKLGYLYKDCINFPDGQVGWYPFALRAGRKLLKNWRPDFIVGSSSPVTSLLVAKKLAAQYQIPWVADLRDLWSDNHNADLYQSGWRRKMDLWLEKRVLGSATALVTVSQPLADTLRCKYKQPISVITNGYDLADYPKSDVSDKGAPINIVYTGIIHPGKRDPSPLFKAMTLLGDDAKKIRVSFYGRSNEVVKRAAAEYGVEALVHCYETVSYQESLKLQVDADVLLLLTHNSDREKGVITTKFFEYLGARRLILFIGCINGVAADIIRSRKVGFTENDPNAIADILKKIIADKENGIVTPIGVEAVKGFSREEQAMELVAFLKTLYRR